MSARRPEPRIAPGSLRDTGPLVWAFARLAGRVTRTGPPAIFTTLGRGRGLFWGWLHFAGRLMPGGKLPRRETELVILRVAVLRDCAYELEHHVRLGRRAGVTSADVERIREGSSARGWSDREQLLLTAAEELVRDRDLTDSTWHRLSEAYDDRTLLELVLLVGHYDMLATTLLTLRIQPERPQPTRPGACCAPRW
ncbi:MAG TPA: carboxymuconolactone decarboxylase family protein [Marmoricola sp.]|jgi:AhpD family alkylhydroperoxidase|nr:carboxymuconolactone decarboxylase family protein [Marmoricola sp.]